jgi:hypothetical protein
MTESMVATGNGSVVSLLSSPTGGEGLPKTQSLEGTAFWLNNEGNGKQRTVTRANLTILCAPGNSKFNQPLLQVLT